MRSPRLLTVLGLGIAIAALVGWFVWPTPYIYSYETKTLKLVQQKKGGNDWNRDFKVRFNRFTGEKQVLRGDDWGPDFVD